MPPPSYPPRPRTARSESYEDRRGICPTATGTDGARRAAASPAPPSNSSSLPKPPDPARTRAVSPARAPTARHLRLSPAFEPPCIEVFADRASADAALTASLMSKAPRTVAAKRFSIFPWRRRRCGNVGKPRPLVGMHRLPRPLPRRPFPAWNRFQVLPFPALYTLTLQWDNGSVVFNHRMKGGMRCWSSRTARASTPRTDGTSARRRPCARPAGSASCRGAATTSTAASSAGPRAMPPARAPPLGGRPPNDRPCRGGGRPHRRVAPKRLRMGHRARVPPRTAAICPFRAAGDDKREIGGPIG